MLGACAAKISPSLGAGMNKGVTRFARALAFGAGAVMFLDGAVMAAGALDKVRQDASIRIAYRADAPPFSSSDSKSDPTGFMVDLCRAVTKDLATQLKVADIKIVYVPVTAFDRFDAIEKGNADLLCEPTTATLSRRDHVDFSIGTFVDGASLLVSGDALPDLRGLGGKKVGVLVGTTTEKSLRAALASAQINADIVTPKTHEEGLAMLDGGEIAAYFADRAILAFLARKSVAPAKLHLAENYLSIEPYALALPRGDEDFRLAVDRALSHIYRSGQISKIFSDNFGAGAQPSDVLKSFYAVTGLPD